MGCINYLVPRPKVTKSFDYIGDPSNMKRTFDIHDFFTRTSQPGCNGIETCALTETLANGSCKAGTSSTDVILKSGTDPVQIEANLRIAGYSNQFCLKCKIHIKLNADQSIFTIT